MKLTATRDVPTREGEYRFCFLSEVAYQACSDTKAPRWRGVKVTKSTNYGGINLSREYTVRLEIPGMDDGPTTCDLDVRDLAGWWVGPLEFEIPRVERVEV